MIKDNYKKYIIYLLIFTIIFALDRITKIYILHLAEINNTLDIYITSFLNFYLIWNKGIAFGLLQSEQILYHIISAIIFFVILLLCFLIYKSQKKWEIIYFSIIVGGAIGNFADRLYYMAVPDFIDLHFKEFHWFTFNVADICITVGIILYLIFDTFKFNNIKND